MSEVASVSYPPTRTKFERLGCPVGDALVGRYDHDAGHWYSAPRAVTYSGQVGFLTLRTHRCDPPAFRACGGPSLPSASARHGPNDPHPCPKSSHRFPPLCTGSSRGSPLAQVHSKRTIIRC